MGTSFLEVKDVVVEYEGITAIEKASLSMSEGEIIALIGANGAGKTSILRTISGLKRKFSGEIWFNGEEISNFSPPKIVKRGLVQTPEGRHLFPYMEVGENLLMGAYLRKNKQTIQKDLRAVLDRFPILGERIKQAAGSLSGGEQQMLAIGRALMAQPKLLLLDEPSLGLSPIMTKSIAKVIVEINRKDGIAVLLVEQNARMALQLSKRGYVMETGRVAFEGDSKELLANDHIISLYLGG
jgi:branched-chain amino acid transport system ATP-binding protein